MARLLVPNEILGLKYCKNRFIKLHICNLDDFPIKDLHCLFFQKKKRIFAAEGSKKEEVCLAIA